MFVAPFFAVYLGLFQSTDCLTSLVTSATFTFSFMLMAEATWAVLSIQSYQLINIFVEDFDILSSVTYFRNIAEPG